MPVPVAEVGRRMIDSMVADLTKQYHHPVSRDVAAKLLFVSLGGALGETERDHNKELRRLFKQLETPQ